MIMLLIGYFEQEIQSAKQRANKYKKEKVYLDEKVKRAIDKCR